MNSTVNEKLNALRSALTEASTSLSFAEYLLDAEVAFLEEAAKLLKKEMGPKVDLKVRKGTSVAFLEVDGVNQSDMEVELSVALVSLPDHNVTLHVWGDAGMRGHVEDERTIKTGVLTPKLAVAAIMEFLR